VELLRALSASSGKCSLTIGLWFENRR
jgi:hypothetical protein